MATFIGTVKGTNGEASRLGNKESGIRTVAASWQGAVETALEVAEDGMIWATVRMREWNGAGVERVLYRGLVNEPAPQVDAIARAGAIEAARSGPHDDPDGRDDR